MAKSRLKPFRWFHKRMFFGLSCTIETNFQKDDSWIFQCPVLQINQDFPVHELFLQFEDTFMKLMTLDWKLVVSSQTQGQLVSLSVA